MSAEPYLSLGLFVDDDSELTPDAVAHSGGVTGVVRFGSSAVRIQSSSPAALRRLAAALNDAADQAEAITEAGK